MGSRLESTVRLEGLPVVVVTGLGLGLGRVALLIDWRSAPQLHVVLVGLLA